MTSTIRPEKAKKSATHPTNGRNVDAGLVEAGSGNGYTTVRPLSRDEILQRARDSSRLWSTWSRHGSSLIWGLEGETKTLNWARIRDAVQFADLFQRGSGKSLKADFRKSRGLPELLGRMLNCQLGEDTNYTGGLEHVAVARSLVGLSRILESGIWEQLWYRLLHVGEEAQSSQPRSDLLAVQLFAIELPLTLEYSFPDSAFARRVGDGGRQFLKESMTHLLADGIPVGISLNLWAPILGCWTRSVILLRHGSKDWWTKSWAKCWEQITGNFLRAVHFNGAAPFEEIPTKALRQIRGDLLRAAAELSNKPRLATLAKQIRVGAGPKKKLPKARLVSVEEGRLVVLRSGFQRSAIRLCVEANCPEMRLELAVGRCIVMSGTCQPVVEVRRLKPTASGIWRSIFSYSDAQVDVAEFELELSDGWRVLRQFVLGREDQFLYFSDLLQGESRAELTLRTPFPVRRGLITEYAQATRECWLKDKKRRALLIPLSAPEWRQEPSRAELLGEGQGLFLQGRTDAKCLYLPLFMDLRSRRIDREPTWRNLTVAESLRAVSADVAVAYRVQSGRDQWTFYRSFTRFGNRTFLGQNIANEFYAGRLISDGTFESLIEIENTH